VLYSSQDHLRTGTCNPNHPVLPSAKNTDNWHVRKGDLQRAFPLGIPMVSSSALTVAANGERLLCGGFSLGETICFACIKCISDHFGVLSLSPMRDGLDTIIMGSAHDGPLSTLQEMMGDSTKEFHMTSNGEGRIDLPSPRRHGAVASPAPATTISRPASTPTAQALMTIPS
jgi:hypothetical protein